MTVYQQTIKNEISFSGIGVHSGDVCKATIRPAGTDTGIVYRRTDIENGQALIKADFKNVRSTNLNTTIQNDSGVYVSTVEHLMSALWGCGIDNCYIDISAAEVPIMDGSAEPFVFAIDSAGVDKQSKPRKYLTILKEVKVSETDKHGFEIFSSLTPSKNLQIDLKIEFANKVISSQNFYYDDLIVDFKTCISRARTFCLESEIEYMHKIGLAKGGSLDNAIVVGEDKILNQDSLRYPDEFVRHKLLDSIGDLYLSGYHIQGKFTGKRSGHKMNNLLLQELFKDTNNYEITEA